LNEIDQQMIEDLKSQKNENNHTLWQAAKTRVGEPGTRDPIWCIHDGC
jgi:hypothetical protein